MAQENWEGNIEVDKDLIKDGSEYFALKVKRGQYVSSFNRR